MTPKNGNGRSIDSPARRHTITDAPLAPDLAGTSWTG